MRLERLEISGFGRLRNLRLDFGSQLTVVLGSNEAGKSTIHRAIRGALYGIDAGGQGRAVERSDWARWQPWNGGSYGLALAYRLDSGHRFRVAQRLDQREVRAQVQEIGGGDVTDRLRSRRTVSPGRHHLGIDEAVFCAAAWLCEDGLRLGAPDAAGQRAERIQEAIERLADSGREGATATQAIAKLREAMQRVGTERKLGSPLGAATARLRRLELDISDARRRCGLFAEEETRLRRLEATSARAAETALAAERSWLAGRLSALRAQEDEIETAGGEIEQLESTLSRHRDQANFPVEDEDRVIALGGELHQAERAAAEADAWLQAARDRGNELRRHRQEIAAGRRALGDVCAVDEAVLDRAQTLRQSLALAITTTRREEALAAAALRAQALRQEIAATGWGRIPPESLDKLGELLTSARRPARRSERLAPLGRLAAVLAGLASGALFVTGRGSAAAAVIALAVLALGGAKAATRVADSEARQARRELEQRLGITLHSNTIEDLADTLPGLCRLAEELRRQATLIESHGTELRSLLVELEGVATECHDLAVVAGVAATLGPRPDGHSIAAISASAGGALDAIQRAAQIARRASELAAEDERLAEEEARIAELDDEENRRRQAAATVEARFRQLVGRSGMVADLPPMAAVAAFREACSRRREYDQAAATLAEVRHRQRLVGDAAALHRHRKELLGELMRRGGDGITAATATPLGSDELRDLEREAERATRTANNAWTEASAVRARLDGLTAGLPSLADLEDERTALTAARDRALHQASALRRAVELIEAASQSVHRELAPRLASLVGSRLATLTESRYQEVNVDTDHFAVSLLGVDRPDLVPLDVVSHGTRDQVSLLLRLALCEVLSDGGESVPLFLDEPLLSADSDRRRSLLEFLSRLSTTNQVVLSTSDPAAAATLISLCPTQSSALIDLDGHSDEPVIETPGRRARAQHRG
ncbi:MAG: ATP-binding protein [Candidatus Dormibacteria bacterium]